MFMEIFSHVAVGLISLVWLQVICYQWLKNEAATLSCCLKFVSIYICHFLLITYLTTKVFLHLIVLVCARASLSPCFFSFSFNSRIIQLALFSCCNQIVSFILALYSFTFDQIYKYVLFYFCPLKSNNDDFVFMFGLT